MIKSSAGSFTTQAESFKGVALPEKAYLVGYAALISVYHLQVPLPDILCAISEKHKVYQKNNWHIFTPRYTPKDNFYAHLVFALKYEGINLHLLNALFKTISSRELEEFIHLEFKGIYGRRIWFLYEWLTGKELNLPDLQDNKIRFVDVLDEKLQYAGPSQRSLRHRINNNLPGVRNFCPLIRRTEALDNFIKNNLNKMAEHEIEQIHPDLLMRAAAFLLLEDSKASYAIEGENPSFNRSERWGKAIGQAGLYPLSHEEFQRLQEIVIEDFRYIQPGYRIEGGFIGQHDRGTRHPIPVHISAKFQDLTELMNGLIETNNLLKNSNYNAVLLATIIAFGLVFIHPFEDGNGRIHRYLIHHVLAEKNFTPSHVIFPVSYVILKRLKEYRVVLEAFSEPRLKFIKWRPTEKGNVEVLNDTIDLYRYFDATKQAEFLFSCIQETIEKVLPQEIAYLKKYDEMKSFIQNYVAMPDRLVNLLILFLEQGKGKFSKRAREKEFNSLTDKEIETLESQFQAIFLND